jgi:hypothetical protein
VADEVGKTVPEALPVGGGKHRRNSQLLPAAAAAAPQESEIDQYAGAHHGRDQKADADRPDLPQPASCLRLVRALAVEMHENWIEAIRYLNMQPLRDQNKDSLTQFGEAA